VRIDRLPRGDGGKQPRGPDSQVLDDACAAVDLFERYDVV